MQEKYSSIITDFIKSHPLLSANALEKELKLPQSTIGQALSGSRLIPEKHIFPVICLLAGYGMKIDGYDLNYDNSKLIGRKAIEVKAKKHGDGFIYTVKEYRFFATDYFDLS